MDCYCEHHQPLLYTSLSGLNLMSCYHDKDLYDLGDMQLLVSTDRLSAPGKILRQGIPGKGKIINQISVFWFSKLRHIFSNHLVTADMKCFPEIFQQGSGSINGRTMLVWETTPLPIRCIVRGYLTGAAWREYQERGAVCGNKLPAGMVQSQRLPCPIFTPKSMKNPYDSGEQMDFQTLKNSLGKSLAENLRDASLALYFSAWKIAREQGVLIADTSFEFGLHEGKLMLIDECLTPDNSRYWLRDKYRPGEYIPGMGRHLLLHYLEPSNNDSETAELTDEVLCRLDKNYRDAYRRILDS